MKTKLIGRVIQSNGQEVSEFIEVKISYKKSSPLELAFTFYTDVESGEEPTWFMSRDLFTECFEEGSAGCGDVILIDNDEAVTMVLMSPEGTAAINMDSEEVNHFLDRTAQLVPFGRESVEDDIDEFLAALFEA